MMDYHMFTKHVFVFRNIDHSSGWHEGEAITSCTLSVTMSTTNPNTFTANMNSKIPHLLCQILSQIILTFINMSGYETE